MFSLQRIVKFSYVLVLGTAVLVLSRPAPIQAQRTIAYSFLPGQMSGILSRGILSGFGAPMSSFMAAQMMLLEAGIPASMTMGGGLGMAGAAGMNGGVGMAGGIAGGNMVGVGGMMGMGGGMGGMMGMGGGMGGMMGMRGGMMGMGGGMGGMRGGMGGMGGFAGKGFGGFNGKKPI